MKTCPDCTGAPTVHAIEWSVAFFDAFFSWVSWPLEALSKKTGRSFSALSYEKTLFSVFKFLATFHLVKILDKPDASVSLRSKVLWDEAIARGIKMYEVRFFGLPRDFYIAEYHGEFRTFNGLPRPKGPDSWSLSWMDNKSAMKKHFKTADIPVARGRACFSEAAAVKAFQEIHGTVIVKPHIGSRSRHTFIHITNESELRRAFRSAKQLSFLAMIEEELQGFVFRVTLVGKKVAAVMRREPPHVVGDGSRTVRELALLENHNPLRQGHIFHHLDLGSAADEELRRQKLTWQSIPKKGEWVILNQKVGRGSGAVTVDVTKNVHLENIDLFERIGTFLNDDLVGIDFIIEDMAKPWHEQMPCGVIECNSLPFIDLHYFPFSGPVRHVAGNIWNIVFPGSSPSQAEHSLVSG